MRADRLISIVLLLQTRGKMTAAALANELEVSRRTILRDIDALSAAGIPLDAEGGHGGGIALDVQHRTNLTGLKEDEVQALFITQNQALLSEIGLGDAAKQTLLKLLAALPVRHQPSVEYIRQRIYIDPHWWWHDTQAQPWWAKLQQAVYEARMIRVTYENYHGDLAERVLEPYSLVAKSGAWYLVAKHHSEYRTYRVSRMRELVVCAESFRRDESFDLVGYWEEHLQEFTSTFSEYTCTLRVHPDRVGFVRWLVPGRSEVLELDDHGWSIMRVQSESEYLAAMLVFGLGTQGEVIEPQALKAHLRQACQTMLTQIQPT